MGNELRNRRSVDLRWIGGTIYRTIHHRRRRLQWIALCEHHAIHQSVILDPHATIAPFGLGQRQLHPAKIGPLGHSEIHGGRRGGDALDHAPQDVVLRRDEVVDAEHGQVVLDGPDVGFGEPVGGHALAIFLAHHGSDALGVQQRVGPIGPPVVGFRLPEIKPGRALGRESGDTVELGQMPIDDGMEHCLDLRPRQMRVGAVGEHRNIVQCQVELVGQATGDSAARRPKAHRNMRAAIANGKRSGGSAAPIVDGFAPKDVESHCERHPVQQ
ncbi:hypothetical protein ACVWWK_007636 [Bradyrhizobium sp. LB9.1b]